jgi:hypothetical protein
MEQTEQCPCLAGDFYYEHFESKYLGMDEDYGETTVFKCRRCGRHWLEYFMQYEGMTAAGRWFRGLVTPEVAASATAQSTTSILEGLECYYRGGSAFGGSIVKVRSGQLKFWLE